MTVSSPSYCQYGIRATSRVEETAGKIVVIQYITMAMVMAMVMVMVMMMPWLSLHITGQGVTHCFRGPMPSIQY